jgi:nitrite reductase/ring-hydroxylating ferredoxin subunit
MSMTKDDEIEGEAAERGGCPLHDALPAPAAMERRAFLRAAGLALASVGLLSLGARGAEAMPIGTLVSLARRNGDRPDEKRYPVPTTDGVAIDRDNSVIVARAAGKVYAFSLACPHQNTALRWDGTDHQFMCPKHKSHYRADGTFIEGRATRDMDRLPIRHVGDALIVEVDKIYQQDDNLAEWTAAFVTV